MTRRIGIEHGSSEGEDAVLIERLKEASLVKRKELYGSLWEDCSRGKEQSKGKGLETVLCQHIQGTAIRPVSLETTKEWIKKSDQVLKGTIN